MAASLPSRNRLLAFGRLVLAAAVVLLPLRSLAQSNSAPSSPARSSAADAPASVPANAGSGTISARQAREAEDAYLAGAKHVAHGDLESAEQDFGRALRLNPAEQTYAEAIAVTRQQRVTALVEQSARARVAGDNIHAKALLAQALALDPDNPIVAEHLGPDQNAASLDLHTVPADRIGYALANAVELAPDASRQTFHLRAPAQQLLRQVYAAYGVNAVFDPAFQANASVRLDVDDVNFREATRIVHELTHSFAVAVQPKMALVAADTTDDRARLQPQIEETIYLPGMAGEQMGELARVARELFDLQKVTASPSAGGIVVRGDAATLRMLNATYDDMLDGGSDVLLDLRLYEVQKTRTVNVGAQLPSSVGAFSVIDEGLALVNANQTLIQQAIASGVLALNGTPLQNLVKEALFLVASGAASSSQVTGLLGTVGGGLTLGGVYLGSSTTVNLLLNSSDTRLVDQVTLRSSAGQDATFRAGSRYPVITANYSSGVSSSLASQLAGLNVNGTSVSSLLQQYLGSTSVNVPQFQYEDLGLTLKATPTVEHGGDVSLKLDMKLEALGGTSLNSIPVLNSRALTSTIKIPPGQTAMLATLVDRSEMKSITGLPGLNELPGFQGTSQQSETSDDELLITITPHIVRAQALRIASRPLLAPQTGARSATPQ